MNITDYFLERVANDRIAIITDQANYTYADLKEAIFSITSTLRSKGVLHGDRVGLLGENSLFWVASYLAILKIGAVAVPFATVSTVDDIRNKQSFVNCKVLCIDRRSNRRFTGAFDFDLPLILDDALKSKEFRQNAQDSYHGDPDEDVTLMFTSGTTGKHPIARRPSSPRSIRASRRSSGVRRPSHSSIRLRVGRSLGGSRTPSFTRSDPARSSYTASSMEPGILGHGDAEETDNFAVERTRFARRSPRR